MSTYIVLCNFERAGIEALVQAGHQALKEDAKALARELGDDGRKADVKDIWLTTGVHDLVAVVEAASIDDAVAFLIAFSSLGRCSTTTLAAVGDVSRVVKNAFDAHTKIGGARGG